MPVDLDHIVGSRDFWKDSMKQLQEIADGTIERKRKRWEQCVEPWAEAKECRDSNSNNNSSKKQKKV